MSRFQFRAWDVQKDSMLLLSDNPALTLHELFCSRRYIVMQWIGEYDGNDVPIYEGDNIAYPNQMENILYTVVWNDRQARFEAVPIDRESKTAPGLNPGTTKSLMVKGNICGNNYDDMRAAMWRFKFRVWNDAQKIMLPWEKLRELSAQELFSLEDCAVMQWTGHNSGRGEPIYEGDIIVNAKSKNKEPYIVYWGGACIGFSSYPVYPRVYVAPEINLTNDNLKDIVIAGNVYENPEIARCQKLEDIYAQKKRPAKVENFQPCPFCQSENVDLENDEGIWFVKCEDCGAQGGNAYRPENAIVMWNNWKSKGDDK